MDTELEALCKPFLDRDGKVTQLPVKGAKKQAVLALLAEKFQMETDYREKEVNALLYAWHTFGDFYLLRRELVDEGFLARVPDCSRYWRLK